MKLLLAVLMLVITIGTAEAAEGGRRHGRRTKVSRLLPRFKRCKPTRRHVIAKPILRRGGRRCAGGG